MGKQFADWFGKRCIAWLFTVMLLVVAVGCSGSAPTAASVAPASDAASAPKGNAIPDPVLRQARDEAEAILLGLLSEEFDQDENLALVAENMKGYTSWSVKSQTLARPGAAEFKGTVDSPQGSAKFTMTLVKQAGGQWAVATFSGPYP